MKPGYGGELRATTDVASFNSPNFENGRYPDNVECEWLIKVLMMIHVFISIN